MRYLVVSDKKTKIKGFMETAWTDAEISELFDIVSEYKTKDDACFALEKPPIYAIGQKVKVCNWSKETDTLEILDIKKIYHRRLEQYCWGYKMNGETGLTLTYVPEGYLRTL